MEVFFLEFVLLFIISILSYLFQLLYHFIRNPRIVATQNARLMILFSFFCFRFVFSFCFLFSFLFYFHDGDDDADLTGFSLCTPMGSSIVSCSISTRDLFLFFTRSLFLFCSFRIQFSDISQGDLI